MTGSVRNCVFPRIVRKGLHSEQKPPVSSGRLTLQPKEGIVIEFLRSATIVAMGCIVVSAGVFVVLYG